MVLWEAADRICGKRPQVLIPVLIEAMERHGHLQLAPVVRSRLLEVSVATIDRLLSPQREAAGHARRRRWGTNSAIKLSLQLPPPWSFDLVLLVAGFPKGSRIRRPLT
jgi:hypothetical protein